MVTPRSRARKAQRHRRRAPAPAGVAVSITCEAGSGAWRSGPKLVSGDRQLRYIRRWLYNEPMTEQVLNSVFFALSDPVRRAILARLVEGEATVGELAEPFAISQPAVSGHLRVLEEAGLVATRTDGPRRPRRLEPEALLIAMGWLERYRQNWERNFGRLDELLKQMEQDDADVAGRMTPKVRRR